MNKLIGIGSLFNSPFYLRNPCSVFPHQLIPLHINKKSQRYHLSSYYENKLIGVGLLFNGPSYSWNPCLVFPHHFIYT